MAKWFERPTSDIDITKLPNIKMEVLAAALAMTKITDKKILGLKELLVEERNVVEFDEYIMSLVDEELLELSISALVELVEDSDEDLESDEYIMSLVDEDPAQSYERISALSSDTLVEDSDEDLESNEYIMSLVDEDPSYIPSFSKHDLEDESTHEGKDVKHAKEKMDKQAKQKQHQINVPKPFTVPEKV